MSPSSSIPGEATGDPEKRLLILGIGNLLMGDEGVGVHLARRFAEEEWPEGVDVEDGGTAGLLLMGLFESYPTVVLIDAALEPDRAGQFRLVEPKFSKDYPTSLSSHDIGLKDLLDGLQFLGRLPKVFLFVVSVPDVQPLYIGLSPQAQAAADQVAVAVRELVNQELKSGNVEKPH